MASILEACEGKETHEGGGAEGGGAQTWDVDVWLQAADDFDLDAAVNGPRRERGEVIHAIPNPNARSWKNEFDEPCERLCCACGRCVW
jgi:hypothetical protein